VQETIVDEEVRESGIKSLGDVPLDAFGRADANLDADESPFNTESETKFIGKEVPKFIYNGSQVNEDANQGTGFSLFDQVMQEADSDLESMPGDKIESLSGFKADDDDLDMANSKNENVNASTDKPSQSDPLGYLYKDISALTSRDSVKQALPKFDKRVKKTLNDEIHELLIKPLNNDFNLLNKKERNRFFSLQKSLAKTIKIKVGKSVLRSVRKEVTIVQELLKYYVTQLNKNDVNLRELVDLIMDLVVLIDSASASAKAAPEGEKKSTQENIESVITVSAPA
ncbi:hypothetical protein Tco_1387616, partial [Tanacetum coccineum]